MRCVIGVLTFVSVTVSALSVAWPAPANAQTERRAISIRPYTRHPPIGGATKVVPVAVDAAFNADERVSIVRAINEWNLALNGVMRFDVVLSGGGIEAWTVRAQRDGSPQASNPAEGQPLSSTQAGFLSMGGRVVLHLDRIGTRDLRGVMLHELGHVLGLGHDPTGNLMSARYSPTTDQCVDRPTAELIAVRHNVPLAALNWCEAGGG